MWVSCLIVSVVLACAGLICPKFSKRSETRQQTFQIFFAGLVVAIYVYMWPIYWTQFTGQAMQLIHTICMSLYNTIALFVIGGDYSGMIDAVSVLPTGLAKAYGLWTSVLFVLAPLMTFGFIVQLFSSIRENIQYRFGYSKNSYVFSALNEKSYLLAQDLASSEEHVQIVFSGVTSDDAETELGKSAKSLGAVLLRNEVTNVKLSGKSRNASVTFLLTGENESENVFALSQKYGQRPNTTLIFIADDTESELLLSAIDTAGMKMIIRRKSVAQSLIYRHLYENGHRLFETAAEEPTGEKAIRAVVLGLGELGQEMTRSLSWYAQMIGYTIQLDAIGTADEVQRLQMDAPEMFDPKINGKMIPGEAQCKITVHETSDSAMDVLRICRSVKPTYILIDLDDDAKNIETAVSLRTTLLQTNDKPVIDTVIRDAVKNEMLQNLSDRRQTSYDITIIGSDAEFYAKDTLLSSKLDEEALVRHMQYCMNADAEEKAQQEKAFWRYEYNYRSSMASAIHKKARMDCNIPGANKPVNERSEEEKQALRILEHRRWNAYMRSEGYCYGEKRNDLAKLHHCLVPFDALPEAEKIKDDD